MPTLLKSKSIYFNDVNLLPAPGKVKSRKEVPNELHRVIVSPMVSVVGETFIKEAAKLGLSVCTPRFLPMQKKINGQHFFNINRIDNRQICFLSIGLNESLEDLLKLNAYNRFPQNVLFDIANGYVPHLEESVKRVYDIIGPFKNLMVGNIVTLGGFYQLEKLVDYCDNLFIRVGIGNGKPCSSSDVAAVNRGQLTELFELVGVKDQINKLLIKDGKRINLISDGGISKSGFALKAFGAGADYVLMGSYFSKAEEAETHISGDGTYFGCASEKQNKLAGLTKHSEGKVMEVNKNEIKPLKYLVDELWGGISSGISYVGYQSVGQFIGKGIFEEKCNSLPPKGRV